MKKILSLTFVFIIITMVCCTKKDSQDSTPITSSTIHATKLGMTNPQKDGTYTWNGDPNNLACAGKPNNCTITHVIGHIQGVSFTDFSDSVSKGSTGVANFFNNYALTNNLFPFFTAIGADSATQQTLINLQSGNYYITGVPSDSGQVEWMVQQNSSGTGSYLIVTDYQSE